MEQTDALGGTPAASPWVKNTTPPRNDANTLLFCGLVQITSKTCTVYPSHLLPGQRHIHLVGVTLCEDNRPKDQLEASKQQHCDVCRDPLRASAQITLHTILLGMCGVIYTPHTLEPLEELGLGTHIATKLALKLHAHSVQHAFELSSTRRALEKNDLNSRHQDQARATASTRPDPH
eukprot:1161903-Pelagomonas_calceolata.AAC.3